MFQAECQTRYVTACLVRMIEENLASLEVRRDAHDNYVERVDKEHQQMIWSHPGMTTYYRNTRGRVVTVMPWRLVDYWEMTHEADLSCYHVEHRTRTTR
jgi:4-hydroxyacetophenone monooxygenase